MPDFIKLDAVVMNKVLKGVGIATLALLLVAGVGVGALVHQGRALDRESATYVENAIPAIAADWDKRELVGRATPELMKAASPDQIANLFERFSRLGALVSVEPPKGQAFMLYTTAGNRETANYTVKATFANGDALVRMQLLKRDGRWLINGFYVDSKLTRDIARA